MPLPRAAVDTLADDDSAARNRACQTAGASSRTRGSVFFGLQFFPGSSGFLAHAWECLKCLRIHHCGPLVRFQRTSSPSPLRVSQVEQRFHASSFHPRSRDGSHRRYIAFSVSVRGRGTTPRPSARFIAPVRCRSQHGAARPPVQGLCHRQACRLRHRRIGGIVHHEGCGLSQRRSRPAAPQS